MVQALQKSLWAQILGGQASGLQLERKLPETGAPPTLGPLPTGQSSLSDSVSYCADSSGAGSRSQILLGWCGAAGLAEVGVQATGVGGVLLSIRMVRGL